MEERLVRFSLFGQEFTFYSDASESEVDKVVGILRNELEGSDGTYTSTVPSSKLLVLGCLRIAARYVKLSREFEEYRDRQDRSIDGLIDKMSEID
ncbi:MAG TPA: cell division protein ZapA [Desulfobulbaceae bacterium]|nr:cell division protein ZapA [Desulfobulbaceae bacterium]